MLDGDKFFAAWGARTSKANSRTGISPKPRLNDSYCLKFGEAKLDDFEAAWLLYPRKVAKHPARLEWARMSAGDRFAASQSLPVHIQFWQLAGRSIEYVPHFRAWLHQRRWEDELEMPKPKAGEDWMRSTAGIMAKAKEVGIEPKLGEDWHCLKARVMARAA